MDPFALFSRGETLVRGSIGERSLQGDDPLHRDLIRLIAIATALKVDILPLTWQPALESLGQGGTGWISQSSLNDRVSFAFKRFNRTKTTPELTESEFRALQFDAMISEIIVLSCPEVYGHPNVINLEGLCWEISRPSGEVWPVLVFQKAKCGDLRNFLTLPEAEDLTLDTRIEICGEVAKALRIMHQCGIVHGDIKPENVLVTKGQEDDVFGIHVTDFGYSSFETLVKVPRSEPWEAPEWHSRWFNLENAKKMDVYTFGLLCLWLLFPGESLRSPDSPNIDLDLAFSVQQENNQMMTSFQEMKASGKLLDSVLELISQSQEISKETRSCLEQVFTLTLPNDPEKRAGQMEDFVDLLCNPDYLDPLDKKNAINAASIPSWHGTFQLEKFFFQVDACDYKVQQRIVEQLIITAKDKACGVCSKNAAFQLALCYSFGFGGRADSDQCQNWLEKSGKSAEDLKIQLDVLRKMNPQAESTRQLVALGLQSNLLDEYREQRILEEAVVEYEAMAAGREEAFGITHFSTRRIRGFLGGFLEHSGRPEAAIKLRNEDIMFAERELGPNNEDIIALKCRQVTAYEDFGKLDKARELAEEVLNSKMVGASVFGLQALTALSSIALEEGRLAEAIERGIAATEEGKRLFGLAHNRSLFASSMLATAYARSGNFAKAIEINEEVAQLRELHIGPNHPDTIETLDRLGLQYNRLNNNEKASKLFKRVWQSRMELLGKTAVATLRSGMNYAAILPSLGRADEAAPILESVLAEINKSTDNITKDLAMTAKVNLAVAYQFQRNYALAEPLGWEVLAFNRDEHGNSNETTLKSMGNLSDTLFNQRKWGEAFDLAFEEVTIRKSISDEADEAKISAMSKATISLAKLKSWDEAASLLDQELGWRKEMMKTPDIEFESRHSFMETLALAATVNMNLQRLEEARCHVAAFLEKGDARGLIRPSIIETIEDLAILCDENGFSEEAEQLSILEILIKSDFFPGEKDSSKQIVKRILDLKERMGTTGSRIIFEPSALVRRAREIAVMHSGMEKLEVLDEASSIVEDVSQCLDKEIS